MRWPIQTFYPPSNSLCPSGALRALWAVVGEYYTLARAGPGQYITTIYLKETFSWGKFTRKNGLLMVDVQ